MNNNHMEEVATMIGVSLNESFEVDGCTNPYTLTEDGLIDCCGELDNQMLALLLAGKAKVVEKPWKPKLGDMYYYLAIQDDCIYIEKTHWLNVSPDYELYHMGNFFRTEEEARRNMNAYKEFLKSIEPQMQWRE